MREVSIVTGFFNTILNVILVAALAPWGIAAHAEESETPAVTCDPGQSTRKAKSTCYEKLLQQCQSGGQKAGGTACATGNAAQGAGMATGALTAKAGYATSASQFTDAAKACENMVSQCKDACDEKRYPGMKAKCEEDIRGTQDDFSNTGGGLRTASAGFGNTGSAASNGGANDSTNPTNTTAGDKSKTADAKSGGGGMSMGSMLQMGAMAGMVGMAMMKNNEDNEAVPTLANNSALQANGTVLCDKADSGVYAACNSYLEQACTQAIQNNTLATSATCTTFSNRYCTGGDGVTTDTAVATTLSTGTTMPVMGVQGAGSQTVYCQNAVAYAYCIDGFHSACPSCQNLARLNSAAYQSDPTAGVAQSSFAATSSAPPICGGDPMVIAAARATSTAPAALPVSSTQNLTAGLMPPTSAALGVQTVLPQSAGQLSVYRGPNGLAPASTGTPGPTSDVGAEFGPSLSSITATAIQHRCQNDQLNCP